MVAQALRHVVADAHIECVVPARLLTIEHDVDAAGDGLAILLVLLVERTAAGGRSLADHEPQAAMGFPQGRLRLNGQQWMPPRVFQPNIY